MSISAIGSTDPPVVFGHPPNTFIGNRASSLEPPTARQVSALALGASLEVLPRQVTAALATQLTQELAAGTEVYLPCLPKANWQETAAACERLHTAGLTPIPHLAARSIASLADLDDRLAVLAAAGVDRLLLIAGDRRTPAGPFAATLPILESGQLKAHGFRRVGFATHPEGHPHVDQATLAAALARKVEYARATGTDLCLVTQFVFAAPPTIELLRGIARAYPELRVRAGIPGPAKLRTLIGFAARCGAGPSIRALTRKPGVVRLFGHWSPDALLVALARYAVEQRQTPLAGIHLFTFGGIENTLRWLKAMAQAPPDAKESNNRSAPFTTSDS